MHEMNVRKLQLGNQERKSATALKIFCPNFMPTAFSI